MSRLLPPLLTPLKLLCTFHLISSHLGTPRLTAGPSMLPTLAVRHDGVWISALSRRGRGVVRGDLVSFRHPREPGEAAIKRVLGLPGDYVRVDGPGMSVGGWEGRQGGLGGREAGESTGEGGGGKGGTVGGKGGTVRGEEGLEEMEGKGGIGDVGSPVWGAPPLLGKEGLYVQIPEGHCWLEGDNVPWSKDSRDYGPLPMALIRGKVVARINPVENAGWFENGFREVE